MGSIVGLRCVRCGELFPPADMFEGCSVCAPETRVNIVPVYDEQEVSRTLSPESLSRRPASMWRYYELLPVDSEHCVSLGEGMTPLVACPKLGIHLGIPNLYIKDESQNPTGSFKDRLASAAISVGRRNGAQTVVCSSTGNLGLATAAYAARAGLDCVVLTTTASPPMMQMLMRSYGAMIVATLEKKQRWMLMKACVDELGWFPVSNYCQPLVGSNPYGVDGYKTIGLEICEQLNWNAPDVIASPSAFGEGLWGAWQGCVVARKLGFTQSLPRMVAAEVFGPLTNALQRELTDVEEVPSGVTVAYSVGSGVATYQALHALRESHGTAGRADDDALLDMQRLLAKTEGILAETASVLPLVLLAKLRDSEWIREDEVVVAVLTSAGIKDPVLIEDLDNEVPRVEPDLRKFKEALKEIYAFTC